MRFSSIVAGSALAGGVSAMVPTYENFEDVMKHDHTSSSTPNLHRQLKALKARSEISRALSEFRAVNVDSSVITDDSVSMIEFEDGLPFTQYADDTCSEVLYEGMVNEMTYLGDGAICIGDTERGSLSHTLMDDVTCMDDGFTYQFSECEEAGCGGKCTSEAYVFSPWEEFLPDPFEGHCFLTEYSVGGSSFDSDGKTYGINFKWGNSKEDASIGDPLTYLLFIAGNTCIGAGLGIQSISITDDGIAVETDDMATFINEDGYLTVTEDSVTIGGEDGTLTVEGDVEFTDDDVDGGLFVANDDGAFIGVGADGFMFGNLNDGIFLGNDEGYLSITETSISVGSYIIDFEFTVEGEVNLDAKTGIFSVVDGSESITIDGLTGAVTIVNDTIGSITVGQDGSFLAANEGSITIGTGEGTGDDFFTVAGEVVIADDDEVTISVEDEEGNFIAAGPDGLLAGNLDEGILLADESGYAFITSDSITLGSNDDDAESLTVEGELVVDEKTGSVSIKDDDGNSISIDGTTGEVTVTTPDGTLVINSDGNYQATDNEGGYIFGDENGYIAGDETGLTIGLVGSDDMFTVTGDVMYDEDEESVFVEDGKGGFIAASPDGWLAGDDTFFMAGNEEGYIYASEMAISVGSADTEMSFTVEGTVEMGDTILSVEDDDGNYIMIDLESGEVTLVGGDFNYSFVAAGLSMDLIPGFMADDDMADDDDATDDEMDDDDVVTIITDDGFLAENANGFISGDKNSLTIGLTDSDTTFTVKGKVMYSDEGVSVENKKRTKLYNGIRRWILSRASRCVLYCW
jgi:hypothetical protein